MVDTTLFHNEDFFFPSDTEFRESSEVLIHTTDINPINEDMIISDEGVDQPFESSRTSTIPCKGFIKSLEYFDNCKRAVSEVVEKYVWRNSEAAWFSPDCTGYDNCSTNRRSLCDYCYRMGKKL